MNTPADEHDSLEAQSPSGPELARMQRLLAPLRATIPSKLPPAIERATRPRPAARRWRASKRFAQAAVFILALSGALFGYRLQWRADAPWTIENSSAATRWQVGTELRDPNAVSVRVARIGRLDFAPETQARLLASAPGNHRIALESGRLHARIWAPPSWFVVQVGPAEIVDLGCEFTLVVHSGRTDLEVLSGWVAYRLGSKEVLLPAGYQLSFDAASATLPVRGDAKPAFAKALTELRSSLRAAPPNPFALQTPIRALVDHAQSADAFSLLSVLTQYPSLAGTDLYPRMAELLQMQGDDANRRAWAAGDTRAIERAWQRLPVQPKAWWRHWTDAL